MKTVLAIASIVLLTINLSLAESPKLINFQGRLTDAGVPVADGSHSVTFTIYDQPIDGTTLWTETQNVTTTGGLFAVLLGTNNPLGAYFFSEPNRYLGITVGANPEMVPRVQIVSTAFAFRSDRSANADSLGSHTPAYYLSWANLTGVPAGFADGVDNIGSGDISGITAGEGLAGGGTSGTINLYLDTAGVLSKHIANGTIINEDINGSSAISVGKISGTAMNLTSTQGITGTKTFGGETYFGDSTMHVNDNGIVVGTNAFSPSVSYMLNLSRNVSTTSTRYSIYGEIDNASTGTVYGVLGRASAATTGAANAGNVYGLYGIGISDGANRYAVYASGRARTTTITTGNSYGVYASATDGAIAYGLKSYAASATNAYGLYCEVTGNGSGTGSYNYVHDNGSGGAGIGTNNFVTDNANNGYAVAGTASGNSNIGYGVFGASYGNGTNWAGYFSGDVNVTGTIYMAAKVTKMDHPLDPENQNLLLTGVDSPEMVVKTSGNIVTDAAGEATVVLPGYFTAIASNFRYQLTVVGQFAQAIIGEEISGNQFRIRTDKPGVKVSWEITGERVDSYAKAYRPTPEVQKSPEQRGRYLHPEAFNLSPERSVDYPTLQEISKVQSASESAAPEAEDNE
ncbi:MAG: hypothetical protein E4G91_01955 [Candidatus Zixiibacteriota bacterium]|nr:MAG: hypothetical protein E4G91_01955 [candidate division Zixibacteria bacterium]